jgi:hypothetical protein
MVRKTNPMRALLKHLTNAVSKGGPGFSRRKTMSHAAPRAKKFGPPRPPGMPKNPQKKKNQSRSKKNVVNSEKQQMLSAPAAVGFVQKNSRLASRIVRETGCETVADIVPVGALFNRAISAPINPGNSQLFPKLNALSLIYEKYRFRKLRFTYVPAASTATSGRVCAYVDYDPLDTPVSSYIALMANETSVACVPWAEFVLDVDVTHCAQKWFFVRQNYTNNASVEDRQECLGDFYLYTDEIPVNTVLGSLVVEYDIEFSVPKPQSSNVLVTTFPFAVHLDSGYNAFVTAALSPTVGYLPASRISASGNISGPVFGVAPMAFPKTPAVDVSGLKNLLFTLYGSVSVSSYAANSYLTYALLRFNTTTDVYDLNPISTVSITGNGSYLINTSLYLGTNPFDVCMLIYYSSNTATSFKCEATGSLTAEFGTTAESEYGMRSKIQRPCISSSFLLPSGLSVATDYLNSLDGPIMISSGSISASPSDDCKTSLDVLRYKALCDRLDQLEKDVPDIRVEECKDPVRSLSRASTSSFSVVRR